MLSQDFRRGSRNNAYAITKRFLLYTRYIKSCQFNLLTSGLLEPSDFSVIPRNRFAHSVWSRTQYKMNKAIFPGD